MRIENQKTKAVHRAMSDYMRSRIKDNRAVDFTSLFHGIDDRNVAGRVEDLIGGAIRLTAGQMAYDASPTELRVKMKQALKNEDGSMKHDENDDVVAKVLALLEGRLTPAELRAVHDILTRRTPSRKAAAPKRDPETTIGEDAAARVAFDHRFPSAARLAVEPTCRSERPPQPAPGNYEGFFERFPSAKRIGL